jgi:hypothetical protein
MKKWNTDPMPTNSELERWMAMSDGEILDQSVGDWYMLMRRYQDDFPRALSEVTGRIEDASRERFYGADQ